MQWDGLHDKPCYHRMSVIYIWSILFPLSNASHLQENVGDVRDAAMDQDHTNLSPELSPHVKRW